MDKRTLTAFLLIFILYMIFVQFVWKPKPKVSPPTPVPQTSAAANSQTAAPDTAVVSDSLFSNGLAAQTLTLENELMTVTFNTRGALIEQVELKKFLTHEGAKVRLLPNNTSFAGMKLIHAASETPLDKVVFSHRVNPDSLSINFFIGSPEAPQIVKKYQLDSQYGIKLGVDIKNYKTINGLELDFSSGLADTEKTLKNKAQDYKFLLYADNEIMKTPLSKLKKKPVSGSINSFDWAALRSKYFTIAIKEGDPNLMRNYSTGINPATGNPTFKIDSRHNTAKFAWKQDFVLYAGPADHTILKTYGQRMENIPEMGASWLRWLSNFFAWFLKFVHRYIKNYGLVLIIFALAIKLITYPLTHKQMEFGLKQQKLQPQIQALQKMYANDRVKLTQEMNKLYKDNKFNPFGCMLPLLIQMPIFISLFNVLKYSLDMRNASFGLWLKDLSEPDPYMILPILMSAFMLLQSLMTRQPKMDEANMDEKQKMVQSQTKIMTWGMPIMFFFMFKGFPAGLVLYWTAFNVLSIIHQYYLNKHFKNKENQ